MSNEHDCAKFIRQIAGGAKFTTSPCRVISVNGATCKVERLLDGLIVDDVRLSASLTENCGLVIKPKVDSIVLVTDIDGDTWFVSQRSAIAGITLDFEGTLEINGGENGGLVILQNLQNNLNALKTYCEALTSAVTSGLNGVGAGSAASGTAGSGAFNAAMTGQSITFESMENTNITH